MKFFSNLFGKSELKPKEVGLIISPSLQEFVRTEVLPGLDISTHYFWSSFESLIDKFINRNNELLDKRNFIIDGFIEKPSEKKAPSNNAVIGRYILPRSIFNKIKLLNPIKGKEVHITDAIQILINDKEKFIAHNFEGKYLDCGTMNGYINSSKVIGKL